MSRENQKDKYRTTRLAFNLVSDLEGMEQEINNDYLQIIKENELSKAEREIA
ncbi:MAG: hypothetical protein BWY47_00423 [Bacteroidetes bacterium ADurb.Bin302]|jgi:hypothetical protein|nr:MAG: hypothetical protein BWY47_00423 [Bacteroidetes bacterium ADurb.Bin302]HPY53598.1 hypothetical protein [Treponemataceae bacterium]